MPLLNEQIAIDPEFRALIPPLAPDELALLETSILAEGVREPLIVWPTATENLPILIDGHNRLTLCQRHNLPYHVHAVNFPDRDAATRWIIENQMGRRNLSAYARSVLALRLKDSYATEAKARQGSRTDLAPTSGRIDTGSRTRDELARLAGIGSNTLTRVAYLDTHAPPTLKAELLAGSTSINSAYTLLRRDTIRQRHQALVMSAPPFPTGTYRTLLVDPPWAYRTGQYPHHDSGQADRHYPTMTTDALAVLPVGDLAAEAAVLLLWGTWSHLPDALELLKAWGFAYVTGLPWIKIAGGTDASGNPGMLKPQYGIGHWVRGCSECLLIAKRGDMRPPTGDFVGLISPNFGHSRKPASVYDLAEQFGGPYVELFARGMPRPGWTAWGAEVAIVDETAAD